MSTPEDACDECGGFHGRFTKAAYACARQAREAEHWPERFCECEQCREWYFEQALEWAEYDERESSP
jgi:hypothetical protein